MRVIEPGHQYALAHLDGNLEELLTFVKREGPGYPGNVGHHPGTNLQEVIRAMIDRVKYVDGQVPCRENKIVIAALRESLQYLEIRAARRHKRPVPAELDELGEHGIGAIEALPVCRHCGHIGCPEGH